MKISIIGCTGRVGRTLIAEVINSDVIKLSGGYVRSDSNFKGFDLGEIAGKYEIGIKASSNIEEVIEAADVVIDFSGPEICMKAAEIAAQKKKAFISGTTGLSNAQEAELKVLGKDTVIVWSQNMSIGINLLTLLIDEICNVLGPEYDTEISETHHKHKKDSPSGTAIMLGREIANAKNLDFEKIAKFERFGNNEARKPNEIGFAVTRAGSCFGEHEVTFADDEEVIKISHQALNRNIFARGALKAALWSEKQKSGFYTMKEVLL